MVPGKHKAGGGRHVAPPPTPDNPRFPEIEVDFLGLPNGQTLAVVVAVERALKKGGVSKARRIEFFNRALIGNTADQALHECLCWVSMKFPED